MQFELREGQAADWPLIRTLMRRSLEDDTYVNGSVWQSWTEGGATTVIAHVDSRAAGVGAMRGLSAASWWMEGPIVHPDFAGQGIDTAILEHLIADFRARGDGILRTGTFSDDERLVEALEAHGFIHIISTMRTEGAARPGEFGYFDPLSSGDIELAMAYLRRSPIYRFASFFERGNLLDYLTEERMRYYLDHPDVTSLIWTQYQTISGLVMMTLEPPPPNHDALYINYLDAMEDTTLLSMLDAIRAAAHQQGKTRIVWKMPLTLGLESTVAQQEIREVWSAPYKVYELPL
jgi:GNAT superfamily N-acetyltransferase